MTDMANENGSRKKFMVPLVVLLLCAVSLTGAAYAYNANLNNGSITDTDVTYFQVAFSEEGKASYSATSAGTVEFNQTFDAKTKATTFKTAGNTVGTFGTQLDMERTHNCNAYHLTKVTVTCVEDSALKFTAEIDDDGVNFTVKVAAGQTPTVAPSSSTTYTLNIDIEAESD